MAFKNQTNFTAKIEDVGVNDIKDKLNYKLDNIDDRMSCVENALSYGDKFYQEFFDTYCNVGITSNDTLLSENNVVRSLESMANYILAKDEKSNNSMESFFVEEQGLIRKINREDEFNNTGMSMIHGFDIVSDDNQQKDESNYKKLKKQMITADDLARDDYLGDVLRDYNVFLELTSKYTKKNNGENGKRIKHLPGKKAPLYVYTKHQSSIKDDMIICKDSLMRKHGYNLKNFSESTQPDYSVIDITNKEHLLGSWVSYTNERVRSNGLLSFKATDDYQNDFNCILIDLENILSNSNLTDLELSVLELYQKGLKVFQIEEELEITRSRVETALNNIANKVISNA